MNWQFVHIYYELTISTCKPLYTKYKNSKYFKFKKQPPFTGSPVLLISGLSGYINTQVGKILTE